MFNVESSNVGQKQRKSAFRTFPKCEGIMNTLKDCSGKILWKTGTYSVCSWILVHLI